MKNHSKVGIRDSRSARSRALVAGGTVAFDLIFEIHGKIQDEILISNGKLGRQNLMFTAKSKESYFGGTAGNVAYGLGLLGVKPLLFSVVGKDYYPEYSKHLEDSGVDSRVIVDKTGYTGTFYGMSDELGQQVGVYQPNSYEKIAEVSITDSISKKELRDVGVVIFSAGTGKSILKHMKDCRRLCSKDAIFIFDPGQVISIFYDKKLLLETLKLADIFIGNEVEISQLEKILGFDKNKVLASGVRALIETRGEKGSVIFERTGSTYIKPVKPKKFVEATGAGDAYRAGMIKGLLDGKGLKESCELGSKIASKSIEFVGAQSYRV